MSDKRISVIVPVRDGELSIEEALDLILTQTRPAAEVIGVERGPAPSGSWLMHVTASP